MAEICRDGPHFGCRRSHRYIRFPDNIRDDVFARFIRFLDLRYVHILGVGSKFFWQCRLVHNNRKGPVRSPFSRLHCRLCVGCRVHGEAPFRWPTFSLCTSDIRSCTDDEACRLKLRKRSCNCFPIEAHLFCQFCYRRSDISVIVSDGFFAGVTTQQQTDVGYARSWA